MATENKQDPKMQKPDQAPQAPEVEKTSSQVRAIHGDMVDLSTGTRYTQAPTDFDKLTGWMQMQIEAGKMEVL